MAGPSLAVLGIKVDNGDVVTATASLDKMTVAGGKTEAATQRLTRRMALAEIAAREMDQELGRTGRQMAALETEARKMDQEMASAARAMALTEIEARKMDAQLGRAGRAMALLEIEARKMDQEMGQSVRAMALLEIEAIKMDAAMGRSGRSMALIEIEARKMDAEFGQMKRAMGLAEVEAYKMDAAMRKTTSGGAKLASGMQGLGSAIQAVAAALFVRQLAAMADAYTNLHSRLGLVTTSTENLAAVEGALFRVSQQTRTDLEANVALYSSLARSTKALGLNQADLVAVTKSVAQSFIVSGASVQETNAAVRQLGQAFASGVLRGDEFNSIAENAPRLQQAVAASLHVTIGELRAMAAEGKITGGVIAKALLEQGKQIEEEFSRMPVTIGGAITQIKNAILLYVGTLDSANSASASFAEGLSWWAEKVPTIISWIGKLVQAIGLVGTAMATVAEIAKNSLTGNWGLNSQLLANYKAELKALFSAPVVVKAGTLGASSGGAGVVAAPAGPDAAARKAAERLEHQRLKEEDDRQRAEQRYVDDINEIWNKGMADVVASTHRGFVAVIESANDFVGKLAERMRKEGRASLGLEIFGDVLGGAAAGGAAGFGFGQSLYSSSHGGFGNTARGALGGAAAGALAGSMVAPGIGTAVGAMAGFVGGILGVGSASREASKAMAEAVKQVTASMAALRASVHGETLEGAIAAVEADRAARAKAIEEAWSGGGAGSDRVAWRTQQHKELNGLEDERIRQLREEYALAQARTAEDLQVRLLTAQGRDEEARTLALQLAQERERQALIKSFGESIDPTEAATLSLLDQVQAQEKLAAATNKATSSALNMVEGYKDILQANVFRVMASGPQTQSVGGAYAGASYSGPMRAPSGPARGTPQPTEPITLQPVVLNMDGRVVGEILLKRYGARDTGGSLPVAFGDLVARAIPQ